MKQLAPTTEENVSILRQVQAGMAQHQQASLVTHHALHAGVYIRSLFLKKDTAIIGATIKVPTVLTIVGHVKVTTNDGIADLQGCGHLTAEAGRKQMFYAVEDSWLSMSFATDAQSVEEAENIFTDDANMLLSRADNAVNIVNGEMQT